MNEQLIIIEKMRRRVFWQFVVGLVLPFIIIFGGIAILRSNPSGPIKYIFFAVLILAFFIDFITGVKAHEKYRAYYKNHYIDAMIKSAIPDGKYQPDQGLPSAMISKTGLIMMGNVYQSEDLITGTYNNVEFQRADVVIRDQTTDSEGHTQTTTYFQGRWMVFESNKYFEADLQIIQKGFGYAQKRTSFLVKEKYRRHAIETEDMAFNKKFKCLCQNDQEAFYLLTPVMMQGLMKLAAESDGKIMVGFVNNVIHVAIKSHKDSLEPPLFRRVSNKHIGEIQREIHAVTSFVEEMRIDNKIYMQKKY